MKNVRLLLLLFVFLSLASIANASSVAIPPNVRVIKDYGGDLSSFAVNRQLSSPAISCEYNYYIYADNHTDIQATILIYFGKYRNIRHFDSKITIAKGKADIKLYTQSNPELIIVNNGQTAVNEIIDEATVISDMASTWTLTEQAFKDALSADEAYIAMPMNNGDIAWIFIPKDVLKVWNDMNTNNIDYTFH